MSADKTFVVLCDPNWTDWQAAVRTAGLDLYPPEEGVEFVDAVRGQDDPLTAVWGQWPRYARHGGAALMAELRAQADGMPPEGRLALVFVHTAPDRLDTPGAPGREELGWLRDELEGQSRLATRVLRVAAFTCPPSSKAGAAATVACQDERLFDCALFISDQAGGNATARRFSALRVAIDIIRQRQSGEAGDHWSWLRLTRNQQPYLVLVPREHGGQIPGLERARDIIAFFDKRNPKDGLDADGNTIQPVDTLLETLSATIAAAVKEVAPISGGGGGGKEIDAHGDTVMRPRSFLGRKEQLLVGQPTVPNDTEVTAWTQRVTGKIQELYSELRHGIEENQSKVLARLLVAQRELSTQTEAMLTSVRTGTTGDARGKIDREQEKLRNDERLYSRNAASQRSKIAAIMQQQLAAMGGDPDRIDRLQVYKFFQNDCDQLIELSRNAVREQYYALGVLVLPGLIYAALVVHTWSSRDGVGWIVAFLLNFEPAKFAGCLIAAVLAVAAASLRRVIARRRWQAAGVRLGSRVEDVAKFFEEVADETDKYGRTAASASFLAPVDRRFSRLIQEIDNADPRAAIETLRRACRVPDGWGQSERFRAFENVFGAGGSVQSIGWLRSMLVRPQPDPLPLTLIFDDRPEDAVRSRLTATSVSLNRVG